MPCVATIFNWFRTEKGFLEQYEKAKEAQADTLAEELLDIADDGTNDWMEKTNKDGENIGWQLNGEHVQRSRLRVDTRKWVASKLKPKKYGDKLAHQVTGANGGPIQIDAALNATDREILDRFYKTNYKGAVDAKGNKEEDTDTKA